VPDKPLSSSDLVPPGFHFSDSSYLDAAFDNYLDDMIQEGQDMVKASSDVDVEMKGENALKRSRSQADAPAEHVPTSGSQFLYVRARFLCLRALSKNTGIIYLAHPQVVNFLH
jgi:hypothetical protein